MSHTVSPQVNDQGEVVGFDVQTQHEGYWKGSESDYVEYDDGSIHHVFEGAEINEGQDPDDVFTADGYWQHVITTEPDIPDAIQWAGQNLSEEFINDFNAALEADDRDEVHQYLMMILEEYRSSDGESYEDSVEEDSFSDVSDEDISAEVDTLLSAEPDYTLASEYGEAAQAWLANGYEVEAALLELSSDFHTGAISADEAISIAIERYGDQAVIQAYQRLHQ